LRLQGEKYARVEPASVGDERRAVRELWQSVLGEP